MKNGKSFRKTAKKYMSESMLSQSMKKTEENLTERSNLALI